MLPFHRILRIQTTTKQSAAGTWLRKFGLVKRVQIRACGFRVTGFGVNGCRVYGLRAFGLSLFMGLRFMGLGGSGALS